MFIKLSNIFLFTLLTSNAFSAETLKETKHVEDSSGLRVSISPRALLLSDVYATENTIFERVITLGSDCGAKGRVNLFFAPENKWLRTKTGHADLIDWVLIRDYDLLAEAFLKKLKDFFDRADFCLIGVPINLKYNISWTHVLHKVNEEGQWDEKEQKEICTEEQLTSVFPTLKSKANYLTEKFISAKDKTTLYYIVEDERWTLPTLETLIKLRNSITHIREGNKNFVILYSTLKKRFESTQNILVREHTGAAFHQIFSKFKFARNIWD